MEIKKKRREFASIMFTKYTYTKQSLCGVQLSQPFELIKFQERRLS